MGPTTSTCTVERRYTGTVSLKEPTQPISRLSSLLRSSSSSTCRPLRRLGSRCHCLCSFAPTSCSNETPRVHHAARRHGGYLAARGPRPAANQATDHPGLGLGHSRQPRPIGRPPFTAAAWTPLEP